MGENFDNQSLDDIKDDKPVEKSAADVESEFRLLEFHEAKKAMRYRSGLFWWGIISASLCLLCSVAWMLLSVFANLDTRLGVAFIASLAVEVIGIVAIIAKYLFPDHGMPRSRDSVKSVSEDDLSLPESS